VAVDEAGQPGDAADDADRGGVEVRSLPGPLLEEGVDGVSAAGGHATSLPDSLDID
jgi:hypothetical protein